MNLATAKHYADKLCEWIVPYIASGTEFAVAGSVRRERPVCNDVDIVCIPKLTEERDLLGTVTGSTNHLHKFLQDYVAASGGKAKFQSGGERPGKCVILQLPKCQLDLWFATPETFATRLLCRTGSMQHNIWLATRAKRQGDKWNPYEGIHTGGRWICEGDTDEYQGGALKKFASETEIYVWLGLPFIEPQHREHNWLAQNFGE